MCCLWDTRLKDPNQIKLFQTDRDVTRGLRCFGEAGAEVSGRVGGEILLNGTAVANLFQ